MLRTPLKFVALAVALVCLPVLGAGAQAHGAWNRPTTLHAKDEPLDSILREIASTTKSRIELTPPARAAAAATRMTAAIDEVSLRQVIEMLLRTAHEGDKKLAARFEDDRCIIDLVDAPVTGRMMGAAADRSPDRRLVTYEATDVTILRAITDLLDKVKTGCRIHPAVRAAMNVKRPMITIKDLELRAGLGLLTRDLTIPGARVTWWYEPDPGCYVFIPEPIVGQPILRDETVTLTTRDEPVATAVKRAMDAAGASYAFSPQVLGESPATIEVKNVPLDLAIRRLFRSGRVPESFSLEESGGVFAIRLDPAERSRVPVEPTYTARFDNSDIRYALKALFLATSENYTLDTHVSGTVTTAFQNLPLRAALEQVLKNAKSPLTLTYRLDGTVYKVYPNKDWENWK